MQKIKEIISWIFSIFMFLSFAVIKPFSIFNVLSLCAGLSIMPPIVRFIIKRKKYYGKMKWCVFIILFTLSMFAYPGSSSKDYKSNESTNDYVNQSEEQTEQQEEKQAEEKAEQQEEEQKQAEEKAKQQEEEKKQAEDKARQQEEGKNNTEDKTNQQEKGKQKSSINSNENKDNSRTVYITPTGKCYHYSSECAGKNAKVTTKNQAETKGLAPCKKCAK